MPNSKGPTTYLRK